MLDLFGGEEDDNKNGTNTVTNRTGKRRTLRRRLSSAVLGSEVSTDHEIFAVDVPPPPPDISVSPPSSI